jgi:hypothetical protein
MTISTRRGKIFANLGTTGLGALISYTITGGTGRYAGSTGTGEGSLSILPAHGKGPPHGRFRITFMISA